jgi:hypothetical protein
MKVLDLWGIHIWEDIQITKNFKEIGLCIA